MQYVLQLTGLLLFYILVRLFAKRTVHSVHPLSGSRFSRPLDRNEIEKRV